MINTQRMSSMAFSIRDGQADQDKLTPLQRKQAIRCVLTTRLDTDLSVTRVGQMVRLWFFVGESSSYPTQNRTEQLIQWRFLGQQIKTTDIQCSHKQIKRQPQNLKL